MPREFRVARYASRDTYDDAGQGQRDREGGKAAGEFCDGKSTHNLGVSVKHIRGRLYSKGAGLRLAGIATH